MKEDRSELFVGIFVFIGLAIIGGLVLRFSHFKDSFRDVYRVKIEFVDAGGIIKGSEVRFAGAPIGKVVSSAVLKEDWSGVVFDLEIYDEYRFPKNAKVVTAMEGLVGDSYIKIDPPSEQIDEFWKDGDYVIGKVSALDKIQENAEATLEQVTNALDDLDSAILKFNESILDDENLERFDVAVVELTSAIKSLNEKVLGDANTENLKLSLENIRIASENLAKGSERFEPILAKGEAVVEQIGPAFDELREVVRNVNEKLDSVESGDGLVNALVNDVELRKDFELFFKNLKKYGILRYRDTDEEEEVSEELEEKKRRLFFGKKRP